MQFKLARRLAGETGGTPVSSTSDALRQVASSSLEVYLLGVVDFQSALILQERMVQEVSERRDTLGKLLLCEHPPILTIGREGSISHLRVDERELTSRRIDVRWLNRGGGCMIHAPGQLAAYPILPLDRLNFGLHEYRKGLEQAAIEVCREMRIPAFRDEKRPGVWCRTGRWAEVGIAVRSWVSYHGLFVNVATPTQLFDLIESRSAGEPDELTTLSAERHSTVSMHVVREALLRHLARELGYEEFHLYTGHPLLKRTRRRVHVHA